MPNAELPLPLMRDLLTDAAEAGFPTVRLYGGEPLLHRDLTTFIELALQRDIKPYVTTNGLLLDRRMTDLYNAGLRALTIGFYGITDAYDAYVARDGAFAQLERSVASVRHAYGMAVDLQINYLLTKQTCSVSLLQRAWEFANVYRLSMNVDLIHYSLPYFTQGNDGELQFDSSDHQRLRDFSRELIRLKTSEPSVLAEPEESIRSIPDWALKGAAMDVPCDAYKLIWVGADGTVQLCYAAFPLGNLHTTRFSDIVGTREHRRACKDAFNLECPHCHCGRSSRIKSHLPSRLKYARDS